METENYTPPTEQLEKQTYLLDKLQKSEENCRNCHPLTPLTCITECNIWKIKNEFRKLNETIKKSSYMTNMLNALKNSRRIETLAILQEGKHPISKLQQKLKNAGYNHSQQTIIEEYLTPLKDIGLVDEEQNSYYTTTYGYKLAELVKNFPAIENFFPPHSECHEERILSTLQSGPKTYEDLKSIMSTKNVARVLNRLRKTGLINSAKEKNYVFYFRTKRDPQKAKFSPTEKRIYENISGDGTSARKLSEQSGISPRITYKHIRKLKGKKLVFARKKPKTYSLTAEGIQMANRLQAIRELTEEALAASSLIMTQKENHQLPTPNAQETKRKRRKKATTQGQYSVTAKD